MMSLCRRLTASSAFVERSVLSHSVCHGFSSALLRFIPTNFVGRVRLKISRLLCFVSFIFAPCVLCAWLVIPTLLPSLMPLVLLLIR